jgi:hypothetical protein
MAEKKWITDKADKMDISMTDYRPQHWTMYALVLGSEWENVVFMMDQRKACAQLVFRTVTRTPMFYPFMVSYTEDANSEFKRCPGEWIVNLTRLNQVIMAYGMQEVLQHAEYGFEAIEYLE